VFDLLYLDGFDLREESLLNRKQVLEVRIRQQPLAQKIDKPKAR